MANSRFEYVKQFELDDSLLPHCWIVIRLDGKGFTKFCALHNFDKPSDARALQLMDHAAQTLMRTLSDIRIGFGQSDEYSFVFHKSTQLYGRRSSKLLSIVVSTFTAAYVDGWDRFLPGLKRQALPVFDGRTVCYPSEQSLKDYLAWRQSDAHINNQYNTCFWVLVRQDGKSPANAQQLLKGTQTAQKNELLWQHGINYNSLEARFRKGTIIIRHKQQQIVKHTLEGQPVLREVSEPVVLHEDLIQPEFWQQHPTVLG